MTAQDTIANTFAGDSRFSIMAQALRATGLDSILAGKGPFTVCAPTDNAFRLLPPETFATLIADHQGQLAQGTP